MKYLKKCIKCGHTKPISEFSVGWKLKNGVIAKRNICKCCDNKRRAEYKLRNKLEINAVSNKKEESIDFIAEALVALSRNSVDKLALISKETLKDKCGITSDFSMTEVRKKAEEILLTLGYYEPKSITFNDKGSYLIIGDTNGKHTPSAIFDLINNILLEFDSIRHVIIIGNNLDDDFEMSHRVKDIIVPVTVLAKPEEIRILKKWQSRYDFNLVREFIRIGSVLVKNQDQISPYTKQSLSTLDAKMFPESTIVNCTRHEYLDRTVAGDSVFIASPGCVCKPHVKKVVKILNLASGVYNKEVYTDSFSKYRKQKEISEAYWEQGVAVVTVGDNATYLSMLRIKEVKHNVYAISTPTKVITSQKHNAVRSPNVLYQIFSDLHAPNCNYNLFNMAIGASIPYKYATVLAGDLNDNRSINPHILNRDEAITSDYLTEYKHVYNILRLCKSNSNRLYVIGGNHERFSTRFLAKNPQFKSLFDSLQLNLTSVADYVSHRDDEWITVGSETYISHGDEIGYGNVTGNNTEKHARMFRNQSIIGHSHSPQIRFGTYRLGSMCNKDQGYNSVFFSNWRNGFALMTNWEDKDFIYMVNLEKERYFYILGLGEFDTHTASSVLDIESVSINF